MKKLVLSRREQILVGNSFSYFLKHFPEITKKLGMARRSQNLYHGTRAREQRYMVRLWRRSSPSRLQTTNSAPTRFLRSRLPLPQRQSQLLPCFYILYVRPFFLPMPPRAAGVETVDLSYNRFDPSLLDGIKDKVELNLTGCRSRK